MKSVTSPRLIVLSLQCVFLLLVNSSSRLQAQDLDNTTISGRVMDQNRDALPGATVTVVLMRLGKTRSTVTDSEGRYRLIQLQPGYYSLRVSLTGFASQERNGIT